MGRRGRKRWNCMRFRCSEAKFYIIYFEVQGLLNGSPIDLGFRYVGVVRWSFPLALQKLQLWKATQVQTQDSTKLAQTSMLRASKTFLWIAKFLRGSPQLFFSSDMMFWLWSWPLFPHHSRKNWERYHHRKSLGSHFKLGLVVVKDRLHELSFRKPWESLILHVFVKFWKLLLVM